jgi:UDP-2,4-diacetamido-2,4,6-trideoxy-beta-L-altropyranose hydrolase
MTAPVALFRCDASPTIGAGHVTRCLALAEILSETGWRIAFTVRPETVQTVPALAASGFKVRVLGDSNHELEALCAETSGNADLLVVDHYQWDVAVEQACRSFARKILVLDDATGRDHDCDVLIDAAAAGPEAYAGHVPAHARVLAGPAYALMRRSFVLHRPAALARRDGRPVKEILVSCGATDPTNVTSLVLDALDDVAHDVTVTVVLSSRAPKVDDVRRRLRGKARLLLDADNMADLMSYADLAIGAPGASAYERAVLGLPSILVTLADNQRGIARLMEEAGAAADGGVIDDGFAPRLGRIVERLLADGWARTRMAQAASALIDGRGAMMILKAVG